MVTEIPEWAVEAAASAPRISAADAGPLIAIFTAVRERLSRAAEGEPMSNPHREDHLAATCRYCGQQVVPGKHGWRLAVNGRSGYQPEDAPYDCGQAPLGYHGADKSSLF
jgi:hypothetical protein